ncbi:MAG: 6-pyruvoyl tetrahydropterin synthase family protein [Pseudobdellovibrionaceae bacterium]
MNPTPICELRQHFHLESARYLPHLPKSHPCSRMHGHSFKVTLVMEGPLDSKVGWVIDYNDVKAAAGPIFSEIDHRCLNEVSGLENPTTEILTAWIFEKVKARLPDLVQVIVAETADTECRYPVRR